MPWTKLVIAAALAATASAALADMLVVRAVGPSVARFKPGQKLADNASVTLGANDQLVLLDKRGTKTLRGPGTFRIGADVQVAANTGLPMPVGPSQARRARVGAVRAPGAVVPTRPSLWVIDAGTAGSACLPSGTAPVLWRAQADKAGETTVASAGGQSATLRWEAGQATQPWPAALPLADKARFTLTGSGAAPGGTAIETRLLPPPPEDLPGIAAALIGAGCQAQLDMVIQAGSAAQ